MKLKRLNRTAQTRMLSSSSFPSPLRCLFIAALGGVILLIFMVSYQWMAVSDYPDQVKVGGHAFAFGFTDADDTVGKDVLRGNRNSFRDRNGRLLAASPFFHEARINPRKFREWAEDKTTVKIATVRVKLQSDFDKESTELDNILASELGQILQKHLSPWRKKLLSEEYKGNGYGVFFESNWQRHYPSAHDAAHVVGYTFAPPVRTITIAGAVEKKIPGGRQKGASGVEALLEQELAPHDGFVRFKHNIDKVNSRLRVEILDESPASDGEDIYLTIDARLQYLANAELRAARKLNEAVSASLILMDVQTGEILAMNNVPTFNPNNRPEKLPPNVAIAEYNDPGSTMKAIVTAIAIEQGKVEPETRIDLTPTVVIAGRSFEEDRINRKFNNISVEQMLTHSSAEGAVRVAEKLTDDELWEGLSKFGFRSGKLLGLPHETSIKLQESSINKDEGMKWSRLDKAQISNGYFIGANLLQLARAYAAIGNQGVLPQPQLEMFVGLQQQKEVISKETAKKVLNMLETVVHDEGTAPKASIVGYRIAGKTGTAQFRKEDERGYYKNRFNAYFVGLAPASNPRFVGAVLVHDLDKEGEYGGGTVAAPIFARVMGHALRLYAVPPDNWPPPNQGEQI